MLQQICEHIHNFFERNVHEGNYSVSGGTITPLPPIKEGQRFRIEGSDLNDGVYTYHSTGIDNDDDDAEARLSDEDFSGSVNLMAVPPTVIELSSDIREWVGMYGAIVNSPFSSETVTGLYGYTKTTKSEEAGGGGYSWQDVFRNRLNKWRKPCL